jgi:tetratricopeptide (TPR) repeat protein
VAELARHALAAEAWEAAARYSQRAAEAAEQVGAYSIEVRHYEQVARLLTISPSREALLPPRFTDAERASVYGSLGTLYANLGEKEQASLLYEELLAEARARGARLLEGQALFMLGKHMRTFDSDFVAAQRLLEEARQIAQEQGDVLVLLTTEAQLAIVVEIQGDFAHAWEYAARRAVGARER